jgi:hypothetical protein
MLAGKFTQSVCDPVVESDQKVDRSRHLWRRLWIEALAVSDENTRDVWAEVRDFVGGGRILNKRHIRATRKVGGADHDQCTFTRDLCAPPDLGRIDDRFVAQPIELLGNGEGV